MGSRAVRLWYFEDAVLSCRKVWPVALALLGACATSAPITKLVGGRQIATRSIDPNAYEHVSRALLFEEQERWQDAVNELREALAFDHDSPELHADLAELLLRLGKTKDAATEAAESLSLGSSSNGLLASAHVRRAQGDLRGAVADLRKATAEVDFQANDDDAESIYLELAQAELEILDVDAAHATLDALCDAQPGSGTGRMRLMAIAWSSGDMAKAQDHLRAALTEEPNHIEALAALAWIHATTGKDEDAKKVFRDALDRSEGSLDIAAAFARFLVGIGASKEAEQLADDSAGPDASLDADNLAARVELERSAHRYARGMALLARAAELGIADNEKTRISLLRAALLKDQGKTDEAVAALLKVDAASPLFFDARVRAAELLRDGGKPDQAMRAVEEAAASARGDRTAIEVGAAVAAALIEEKRGNPTAGIARLEKLLAAHHGEPRATIMLAAIEERRGQWQKALALAEALLADNPASVEVLNFWGFIAADHGHALDQALKRLRVASILDPGAGGLIDSLGWVHFRRHELDKASLFLEQAARLEPADPEIQWHLGTLYAERKDTDKANTAFRRALGSSPDDRLRHKVEDSLARLSQAKGTR
jgi:tetratricopeptide (TPR) repeat protein